MAAHESFGWSAITLVLIPLAFGGRWRPGNNLSPQALFELPATHARHLVLLNHRLSPNCQRRSREAGRFCRCLLTLRSLAVKLRLSRNRVLQTLRLIGPKNNG